MINFFNMVAKFFVTIIGFIKFLIEGVFNVIELIPKIISFIGSSMNLLPLPLTSAFGVVTILLCIKAVKRWLI